MARWPIHFVPANAIGLLAPVNAEQLGKAITIIALTNHSVQHPSDRIFELGGHQHTTVSEYLRILHPGGSHRIIIRVPSWIARAISHLCDLFHLTPFSFGHYELLRFDNVPQHNRLTNLARFNSDGMSTKTIRPVTREPGFARHRPDDQLILKLIGFDKRSPTARSPQG